MKQILLIIFIIINVSNLKSQTFNGKIIYESDYSNIKIGGLTNSDLKIYVRKKLSAASPAVNFGHSAIPHSLHGAAFNSGNYLDPPTSVDAADGSAQCRQGSSSGNTIAGTLGGSNAYEGIYVEIQIVNPAIRIDSIVATLNFLSGSQSGSI